jgi:hypothetical protein
MPLPLDVVQTTLGVVFVAVLAFVGDVIWRSP